MADTFDPGAFLQKYGQPAQAQAAPAAPQQTATQPQADAGGNTNAPGMGLVGDTAGAAASAITHFGDSFTFGASTAAGGALAALIAKAMGKKMTVAEGIAAARENLDKMGEEHPYASAAGTVGGLLTGGGAIVKGAEKLGLGALTTFEKGATVANIGKSAGMGAAMGEADSVGHGNDPSAGAAAAGAVGGAVLGPAAAAVTRLARPLIYKTASAAEGVNDRITSAAWRYIGSKLGMSADDLQTVSNNVMAQRGTPMSMAEAVQWSKQGILQQMASKDGGVSQAFNDLAGTVPGQAQSDLRAAINKAAGGQVYDVDTLAQQRSDIFEKQVNPIRDKAVALDKSHLDALNDPSIMRGVSDDINQRATKAVNEIENQGYSTALSVGDVDALRKSAGKLASASYGVPGSGKYANSSIGEQFDDMAKTFAAAARDQHPEYAGALDNYKLLSQHLDGFKAGLSNEANGGANMANSRTRAAVLSDAGQIGYKDGTLARLHGAAADEAGAGGVAKELATNVDTQGILSQHPELQDLAKQWRTRADTVSGIQGTFKPQDTSQQVATGVAHSIGAFVSHAAAGAAYQVGRAGAALRLNASPAVIAKAAQLLTDPTQTQAGIAILRRAGATEAQIRNILQSAGAAYGGAGVANM